MTYNREDPTTWPCCKPLLIAHDVGRSRDRSTAVVGGSNPFDPRLVGITELEEFPVGLFGSVRASALAAVDGRHFHNALIVADLSNDASYAEDLYETFGPRVIGLQISRHGDGTQAEPRPVKDRAMLIYTIGRTYLFEQFHSALQSGNVRIANGPMAKRAYEQLMRLEVEPRESGIVYTCPSGQHDDLGISCAMLNWAARHPHLNTWTNVLRPRRPVAARPPISRLAWT